MLGTPKMKEYCTGRYNVLQSPLMKQRIEHCYVEELTQETLGRCGTKKENEEGSRKMKNKEGRRKNKITKQQ